MNDEAVLVVGTGAMACLFAGLLSAQAEVVMLGTWSEAVRAIRSGGVRLESEAGLQTCRPSATDNPRDCLGVRQALVLVKAWQTPRAAAQLAECLAPEGVALSLQNGLGNLEALGAALGDERAAGGVTRMGATLLGPGRVRVGGRGPTTVADHRRIGSLDRYLRAAGLEVERVADVTSVVWGKLAVNAGINPVAALLRVMNGEVAARPGAAAIVRQAAQEVQAVARALGIELPFEDAGEQALAAARASAENQSSMLQDVLRGARTEIDAINGAVVRLAQAAGAQAPVNQVLWRLVSALTPEEEVG
ncbi:MAG: 2-dehydropantoate 2-reductase [Anaerolineales bacterium]|nr:2-dehydropantoate 2-reductase [Anaerolineales bacterium]